ncbi:HNH endonuclease family protein [Pedobacter alluvionis]|uniref:Uncharacterized protein (TIGR02646 family) n=1 Tax=Pedobacter alluvionis TaxID=475253 RepID=A0A497XVU2_9SPHI|nr:hypothetical protein [Pedobacter alluvionis]RLJ73666.1 uncharacterized protein (TIGR02646 family) [Pedobacter alluvionis]TFB32710.1 hypothetical protein E3V97_01340 [Pedobacter alluvionis]
MIHVDRASVPKPDILEQHKRGGTETAAAIAHYDPYDPQKKAFDFSVYSHPDVKDALHDLFNGKCAYCESTFLHVYPGDVEHFRPKGEIEGIPNNPKPGYYWLAADWDNLLLSCRNCNQKLKHLIHGHASKITMGKMNQFPLSDPARYVRKHDHANGIKDEEPYRLLLNPCVDDPELHLEYGAQGIIRPKKDQHNAVSEMGRKSIEVYVLQRVPLVQEREKVLIDIQAQMQRVNEAVDNLNTHINDSDPAKRFYFEKILKRELARLKLFMDPSKPFLGMARQVIGAFLQNRFSITIT